MKYSEREWIMDAIQSEIRINDNRVQLRDGRYERDLRREMRALADRVKELEGRNDPVDPLSVGRALRAEDV